MKKMEIKNLKPATKQFNNWQGAARLYFNQKTGALETFVYEDGNSWQEFKDNGATIQLAGKGNEVGYKAITMKAVKLRAAQYVSQYNGGAAVGLKGTRVVVFEPDEENTETGIKMDLKGWQVLAF